MVDEGVQKEVGQCTNLYAIVELNRGVHRKVEPFSIFWVTGHRATFANQMGG